MRRNRPRATVTIHALLAAGCGASALILAAGEGSPSPAGRMEGAAGSAQRWADAGPAGETGGPSDRPAPDQLRHPDDPAETLVPVLAGPTNPRPPYFVVGDEFSQPVTAELPGNRCTACHRPSCDDRFAMPLADLRMPAPFDRYHYTEDFAEDRQALRDWCDQIRPR